MAVGTAAGDMAGVAGDMELVGDTVDIMEAVATFQVSLLVL